MEPLKYHIGRLFWETDKIPLDFATNAELCDEIWTGSQYNAQAIRNAGVTKPIIIIPEAIDVSIDLTKIEPYIVTNKDTYKFYSIFEWTERKNPTALLTAYWQEFQKEENVSLTIKTYVDNFNSEKKKEIETNIRRVKDGLGLPKYAPVYLYEELMDRHQIYRFHKTFDCFVSAHRGEGWGIPQMEALLVGNPIVSTNCGGIHEYLKNKKDAMLIPYTPTKLVGNSRNQQWYTPDQNWAEVDIDALRKAMCYCFKYPEKAKAMGISGGQVVREKFCFKSVGNLMHERLKVIEDTILFPSQFK
jgi:glycosyltransferase involved in cell wall biosynthesis